MSERILLAVAVDIIKFRAILEFYGVHIGPFWFMY